MAVKSEPPRPSVVIWPSMVSPWKPATMTTLPCVEQFVNLLRRDVLNLGLGMDAVGHDARLRAGERNGRHAERVQRDGRQRDGRLLAGGQQHVHLALVGQRHDVLGQLDQVVGHAAHGGDDDDDLVALARDIWPRGPRHS